MVRAASATEEARAWLHGIRLGGTHLRGVISAGRFDSDGQLVFCDAHDSDKAIGLELRDEGYSHLVLEVEDPERELARIDAAVAGVAA